MAEGALTLNLPIEFHKEIRPLINRLKWDCSGLKKMDQILEMIVH
jgi:hypothetical protein